jgi:RNA polymerase sigma-70 factor (ECF subfamily)
MGHTTQLQNWLELARRGDVEARGAILEHTCDRLRKLSRKMLRGFPKVRRWSETDDVLQNALLRLHRALAEVRPKSPRQFYGLAATQIRRELLDLAKHFYGAEGVGANHQSDGDSKIKAQSADTVRPETLEKWTRFHQHVEALPEEEREVVALVWYDGLPQPEVATLLGVSVATVKRRWQAARLRLCELLDDWVLEE